MEEERDLESWAKREQTRSFDGFDVAHHRLAQDDTTVQIPDPECYSSGRE
jgi:hypothetical protein